MLQGSTALVTTSEVMTLTTQPIALPVVSVVLSVVLIAVAVITLVVFFIVRRCIEVFLSFLLLLLALTDLSPPPPTLRYKRSKQYKLGNEQTAMATKCKGNQEMVESRVFTNLATISRWGEGHVLICHIMTSNHLGRVT